MKKITFALLTLFATILSCQEDLNVPPNMTQLQSSLDIEEIKTDYRQVVEKQTTLRSANDKLGKTLRKKLNWEGYYYVGRGKEDDYPVPAGGRIIRKNA